MSTAVNVDARVKEVSITNELITFLLVDGRVISVPLAWSWRLSEATSVQRNHFEIIGDGQGVHWPEVDEDLSVEGMLTGYLRNDPENRKEPDLAALKTMVKADLLTKKLRELRSALVAYSGGVDSAYLAWAARQALGDKMLAVLADSPSLAAFQKQDAIEFALAFDIPLEVIATDEFNDPDYLKNAPDRCFHCKDELFVKLETIARERGFNSIIYGVNGDDTRDFRPGHRAAAEHGVRSPLLEAGLTKAEVRELAKQAGLPVWDRPASACLSSRIPYGTPVTIQNINMVENGEDAIRELGFRQFRVRHHGDVVRIEIAPEELPRALNPEIARRFTQIFKKLGYKYVTLDLEGYRSGSLNEVL